MIFDSHAHYDDEKFDSDRDELLNSFPEKGIETLINVGANLQSTKNSIALAERYSYIYAAAGVHPSDVDELNENTFSALEQDARHDKVVAIGEIGLDYYWDKEKEVQENQRYWFRRQLSLAKELQKPVIIHSRDAAEDTLEIMKEAHQDEIPGVIHCFSYSPEIAKEYVKMGYYLGVGGVVTFKNGKKLKETVDQIPLEYLLLETDCPYLAPEPYRGKRNSSLYLPYVVTEIAKIKNITENEVMEHTKANAKMLFGI